MKLLRGAVTVDFEFTAEESQAFKDQKIETTHQIFGHLICFCHFTRFIASSIELGLFLSLGCEPLNERSLCIHPLNKIYLNQHEHINKPKQTSR